VDTLERDLQRLPPELRREVHDFVQFLLTKHGAKPERHLRLDWRGALQDLKDDYDSVSLQHEASRWRR
jgi:hypothetical protein